MDGERRENGERGFPSADFATIDDIDIDRSKE